MENAPQIFMLLAGCRDPLSAEVVAESSLAQLCFDKDDGGQTVYIDSDEKIALMSANDSKVVTSLA